jgi:hypothetical protein
MKTKQDHDAGRQADVEIRRYLWPWRLFAIVLFVMAASIVSCDGKHEIRGAHECTKPMGDVAFYITQGYDWAAVDIKAGLRPRGNGVDPNLYYLKEKIVRLEEGLGENGDRGVGGFMWSVPLGVYKIETLEVHEVDGDRTPIRYELVGCSSGYEIFVDGHGPVILGIRLLSKSSN